MVKAIVNTGKKAGVYVGRVAVRTSGSFNIKVANNHKTKSKVREANTIQGISYRHCHLLQRADGYNYNHRSRR
ncbi:MAG: hypothetical protein ABID54_09990 [Pseudomonadota bacterium]